MPSGPSSAHANRVVAGWFYIIVLSGGEWRLVLGRCRASVHCVVPFALPGLLHAAPVSDSLS